MKLRITQLKAPWPAGAAFGDVVELVADKVPGWALGKCVQVGDEEPATVAFPEPTHEALGDGADGSQPDASALAHQVEQLTHDLRLAHADVAALQAEVTSAKDVNTDLKAQLDKSGADVAALQAELDKAKADLAAATAKKK